MVGNVYRKDFAKIRVLKFDEEIAHIGLKLKAPHSVFTIQHLPLAGRFFLDFLMEAEFVSTTKVNDKVVSWRIAEWQRMNRGQNIPFKCPLVDVIEQFVDCLRLVNVPDTVFPSFYPTVNHTWKKRDFFSQMN